MSLNVTKFKLAEYARNVFRATPEHGTDINAFLQPEYWAHIAAQAKVHDKIEVVPESGEYYMEFLVVAASGNGLRVKPIARVDLDDKGESEDEDLVVKYNGPSVRWCVIRKADGVMIYKDMASKDEAKEALAKHISTKAA